MKISEHIHQLTIDFQIPVTPDKAIDRFVNVFILVGKKIHLIDTGVAGALPQIESYIKDLGFNFSDINNILLTHSHPDHIGALKPLVGKSGAKVFAGKNERSMIEDVDYQFSIRPVPGFHQLVAGSSQVDFLVKEGDEIKLEENLTIRVLNTPGHSQGSTSYYLVEEETLFTGDAVLLPGEIPIFDDPVAYFNSLEKIEETGARLLLSAWDEPREANKIPALLEKSGKYISIIQNAVQKVAEQMPERDMTFCNAVLKELGLPLVLANPLLLKSFIACLN